MSERRDWSERILDGYAAIFLIYLFLPLAMMSIAAFNATPVPSVTRWQGVTLHWFDALASDQRLMRGLLNSLLIAGGVIVLSVPIGLASALIITRIRTRARGFLYAMMVSPILTPGIIIGISTLVFWRAFEVPGGLLLATLAQTSFIASYAMLMFMARLQRFDRTLEEAALDLGASHALMVRRVLLPYLAPTAFSAAVVAFLQSFENYNTTVFSIGADWTLVTEIGARLRFGLTPVVNAIAVIFVALTITAAAAYVRLSGRAARA